MRLRDNLAVHDDAEVTRPGHHVDGLARHISLDASAAVCSVSALASPTRTCPASGAMEEWWFRLARSARLRGQRRADVTSTPWRLVRHSPDQSPAEVDGDAWPPRTPTQS